VKFSKWGTSLEGDLNNLLANLCQQMGFCIPPSDRDRICTSQRIDADEFAFEVLRAEGFDPRYEHEWFREIKQFFVERFGESASASDYPKHPRKARR
jgi:hypothetical protein